MADHLAEAVASRAAARYIAFLRQELRKIPSWHPLHAEYAQQLAELRMTRAGTDVREVEPARFSRMVSRSRAKCR